MVAAVQGQLFVDLDTTFGALANVARPYIQETIEKSAPTEEVTIATLPNIRPFIANTAVLFNELRPGFAAIRPPRASDLYPYTRTNCGRRETFLPRVDDFEPETPDDAVRRG